MMEKESDIQELAFVEALHQGEGLAFDYLFNKYAGMLCRFVQGYLKSETDTEELVQEIFLKIWISRRKIDPQQPFRPYLFTIAVNEIRKHFIQKAKENRFKIDMYDLITSEATSEQEEINFHYYLKILDEQIELLPDKRKEIFILHKKEGLTVNEIADYLHISPKTVENQLTSAIKSIRDGFYQKNLKGLYLFHLVLQSWL